VNVRQYLVIAAAAVIVVLRVRQRMRRRSSPKASSGPGPVAAWLRRTGWQPDGPVALIAAREIRERTRSRMFRVGTAIILLAVAAGVVIPVLRHNSHSTQHVGIVGALGSADTVVLDATARALHTSVTVTAEPTIAAAEAALDNGKLNLVVVPGQRIVLKTTPSASDTSTATLLARSIAATLGLDDALRSAGLSAAQAQRVTHAPPLSVVGLRPAHNNGTRRTATLWGLILEFVLLTQYGTWILTGVVEEKSSRVVEVLLAVVRPGQLLAGKLLGIAAVALSQAALIVAVALGLGRAVGSDLLHGSAPITVVSSLVWLVLGYALYCWIYAAAASLATRQEHIQTLAFPLQLPMIVGYIAGLTSLGSSTASLFVRVLAYLPPTAPFAMPVLVATGQATWWQFLLSAAASLAATALVARLAAAVYLRAILQTRERVRIRSLIGRRYAAS
jgi:ABC-2 type transport system permease protein